MALQYASSKQPETIYMDTGAKTVQQQPRIFQQIEQMEKVLHECFHNISSIENAADRILGPRPQGAEKAMERPPACSVEQKLAEVVGMLESLAGRLTESSNRLNQAV